VGSVFAVSHGNPIVNGSGSDSAANTGTADSADKESDRDNAHAANFLSFIMILLFYGRRPVFTLFNYADIFSVERDYNYADQNNPLNDLLSQSVNSHQGHSAFQRRHCESADQRCSEFHAPAPRER